MTEQYIVRWQLNAEDRERSAAYPTYAVAESCFINLVGQVDRRAGGWAELRADERVLLSLGQTYTVHERRMAA